MLMIILELFKRKTYNTQTKARHQYNEELLCCSGFFAAGNGGGTDRYCSVPRAGGDGNGGRKRERGCAAVGEVVDDQHV